MDPHFIAFRSDWMIALVRESQVFLSQVSGSSLAYIPVLAQKFLARLANPSSPVERMVFRCLLFQLAVQLAAMIGREEARSTPRIGYGEIVSFFKDWGDRSKEMKTWFLGYTNSLCDPKSPRGNALLAEARAILDADYAQAISVRSLAKRLHCHPRWLSRAYRAELGESIPQYLERVRVDHGIAAILESDVKIEAIALAVGYRSKKNFYRAVRRATGCTPTELRALGLGAKISWPAAIPSPSIN